MKAARNFCVLCVFMGATVCLFVSSALYAEDIVGNLAINQVTVYRKGAMVSRTGQVMLSAGAQRLIIKGLPANLDNRTLRVATDSTAVQLGEVEVSKINESHFVSPAERELRSKLEDKTDQRVVIQDEINTAETQLKLLDSLATNPVGSASKAPIDVTNLTAVLGTIATGATTARAKIREAHLRQRALNREIDTINADLAKVATERKQSTEIRISLDAKTATTAPVSLTYAVEDAGWNWVYQARLDTIKKKVTLERQGEVRQGSGEDWKDVHLTLTTSEPSADVTTPNIVSQFLDLQVPDGLKKANVFASSPSMKPQSVALEEMVATGYRKNASVSATQYAIEYAVPGVITLLADRQSRIYPIANDIFDTDLVARVVPSAQHAAFLEATFKSPNDVPIEAGQLQLYRDGAFVGESDTPTFLPGAEVRLPFGKDERIHIDIRNEAANSNENGLINKQISIEKKQRFEITSYHSNVIPVEILDLIPVSKNADIKVEILKGATEATAKDFDGKAGVMLWRFDAQPQKLTSIRHYYSIRYPKDKRLEISNESSE